MVVHIPYKMLFLRKSLSCVQIKQPKSKPLLIAACHRPPNSPPDIIEKIEMSVRSLEAEAIDYIMMGDFNRDLIAIPMRSHTKRLTDIFDIYQLAQLIKEPTRVTKYTETLIYLVITNNSEKISSLG